MGEKRPWTVEEDSILKRLSETHSHFAIAKQIGRTEDAVKHRYRRMARAGKFPMRPARFFDRDKLSVTASNDALIELPHKYLDILRVKSEKTMVFSDVHLPYIDWDLFDKLMAVAKCQQVKTLIIGGDLFDYKKFSTFPDAKSSKDDELTMAESAALRFFSAILEVFEKVYVICGNHDFRIVKWSQGVLSERRFFKFLTHIAEDEKRVTFSAYRHLILNDWRVVHPDSAATNFEVEGRGEAIKYHQNIIMTHVHRMGCVFDPSGKFYVVGGGALIDPTTQAYIMTVPSKMPMWNTGGTIINGEVPYLFPKLRTDWGLWTKKRFL